MSKVYFTSDLHFGHDNLIKGLRGMTTQESDSLIISNWNKTIGKRDVVYLLGDITMEKASLIYPYLSQLNGTIIVVAGNHDTPPCCRAITAMGIQMVGNISYKGYILSHVPLHESQVDFTRGNIHGHLHLQGHIEGHIQVHEDSFQTQLGDKYFNVNTEFHNYTPIAFDEIVKRFNKRKDGREKI